MEIQDRKVQQEILDLQEQTEQLEIQVHKDLQVSQVPQHQ
jgi:hypothetical protein